MAFRSNESPMDFKYDNGAGPMAQGSEFSQAISRLGDGQAKKRPLDDVFQSPDKSKTSSAAIAPATPGQTKSFDTKPLPATPFNDFSDIRFRTPRHVERDLYSSGPENDTSPEHNADSEETPDTGVVPPKNKFYFTANQQPDYRQLQFSSRSAQVSGRGEVPRGNHSKALQKIHKRRRLGDNRVARRNSSEESDVANEQEKKSKDQNAKSTQMSYGSAASVFSFLETHPDLPHILSFYAQLVLNVFIVFFIIFIIYSFWSTIRSDVDKRSEEAMSEIYAEIDMCARSYMDNWCNKENRAPALENACHNWKKCMDKDPHSVGRAKVSAHTFAEIFNSFIEPISYKAMIFSLVMVFGCVAISNFAFGLFRSRGHPPPPPYYMETPQHRFPSGTHPELLSPYQSHPATLPGQSLGALDGVYDPKTPMRKLQYH